MTRRHPAPAVALLAALLLTLPACEQPPDYVQGPKTAANDPVPVVAYPNILFQGDLDQRLVRLGEPIVTPATPTRPMRVNVRLRNATPDTVFVKYRFRFYGPNREPYDVDMPWKTLNVPSTLAADFHENATQVRATDWELEVAPR